MRSNVTRIYLLSRTSILPRIERIRWDNHHYALVHWLSLTGAEDAEDAEDAEEEEEEDQLDDAEGAAVFASPLK